MSDKNIDNKFKSSLGIDENIAALLSYLFGFITGVIFLVLEKESKFVKFHAMQSILLSVLFAIFYTILGFFPIIGWVLLLVLPFLTFALWIILMIKAFKYEYFKLPILGDIVEGIIAK